MPLPPATMSDDASLIKRTAEMLISQGKEVIVLAHSYGGTPTSEGLAGLKVSRIVYLSAIVPAVGETNVVAMGGEEGGLPLGLEDVVRLYPLFSSLDFRVEWHGDGNMMICELDMRMLICVSVRIGRVSPPRSHPHGRSLRQRHGVRRCV
jgi:hypothetical protein